VSLRPKKPLSIALAMLTPKATHPVLIHVSASLPACVRTVDGLVTNVSMNGVLAEGLLVLLNKFRGCASDDLLELRFPDTKFFVVWQFVVTFTSYTCALAYGAGGGWLAYRMGRVRLSFAGVGATVLIVFCR
jgi:hypothetical protein